MTEKITRKEKMQNILFLLIFIPGNFLIFLFLLTHPIGEGSVETIHINILYEYNQTNYNGELATCAGETIEGVSVTIKFYNLTSERDYFVSFWNGENLLYYPPNDKPIIVVLLAEEDNWCRFGTNNHNLIWICVGKK